MTVDNNRWNHGSSSQAVRFASDIVAEVDTYTAAHQHRVARLARAIGEKMGLTEEGLDALCETAKVHDLGKIGLGHILIQTGLLSDAERALVETHAERGYKLLNEHFSWAIADVVLQHHERLDGSGYPYGISGDALDRDARILGVADVVEAMATHRPYRAALGLDAALDEAKAGKGVRYDADVVDACVAVCEGGFDFKEEEA